MMDRHTACIVINLTLTTTFLDGSNIYPLPVAILERLLISPKNTSSFFGYPLLETWKRAIVHMVLVAV